MLNYCQVFYVMGVMKMGNTVPRAGLEPSVLPLHHVGSLISPRPPGYVALLPQRSVQTTTYIYSMYKGEDDN